MSFKAVFGVFGALLPIGYCGYLLLYFRDVSGDKGPVETGLGPTMLGLGAVGLLFAIPLILKAARLLAGSRPTASGGRELLAEESTFDADAALARYLARKAAQGGHVPQSPPDAAPRTGFGRKTI